jgi:hypothetical protein
LLQASGGHGDVLLERQAGAMRDKANQNSWLPEQVLLERSCRQSVIKQLFLRGL